MSSYRVFMNKKTYIAHSKPAGSKLTSILRRIYRRRKPYIALSKNRSTPAIKKNPPEDTRSALSDAPTHAGPDDTYHRNKTLHRPLKQQQVSTWPQVADVLVKNSNWRKKSPSQARDCERTEKGNILCESESHMVGILTVELRLEIKYVRAKKTAPWTRYACVCERGLSRLLLSSTLRMRSIRTRELV